jgi:O-antigen/teichoic acid export membrane protein
MPSDELKAAKLNPAGPRRGAGAQMLAGLVLVGVAGYYLLALAGRSLSSADAAAVAVVYLLANTAGLGLAMAIEQETSRNVSDAIANGLNPGPVIRRMARLAGGIVLVIVVALAAAGPWLVPNVLNGHLGLLLALILSVATFTGLYLVRGVLGGHRRFTGYALTFATEGLSRLVPLAFLDLTQQGGAVSYGLIFALGGAWAALAGVPWLRRLGVDLKPSAENPPLGRTFGMLLAANLLMQVMANVAPVVAVYRMPQQPEVAAVLASAFVLARIPLFVFSPVQTMLLPSIVAAAVRDDGQAVRRLLGRALAAVLCIGIVGVIGAALVGQWALDMFFGARIALPAWMVPVLAGGTILMMCVQVLQPALLAAKRHDGLLVAWASGTVCMLATAFLLTDPAGAAVLAQLFGSTVVVVSAATALLRHRGKGSIGRRATQTTQSAAGSRS